MVFNRKKIILLVLIIKYIFSFSIQDILSKKKYERYEYFEGQKLITVKKLTGIEIKKYLLKKDVYVVDTRDIAVCAQGYIPGSLVMPLAMSYEHWFPTLIKQYSTIILITNINEESEIIEKTKLLGHYDILGYAYYDELVNEISFNFQKVEYNNNTKSDIEKLVQENKYIIDIREISEFKETGVIKEANLIPLSTFQTSYNQLPKDKEIYVYCRSGQRAILGMTFAKREKYTNNFIIMEGGMNKAIEEGYPLVPYEE